MLYLCFSNSCVVDALLTDLKDFFFSAHRFERVLDAPCARAAGAVGAPEPCREQAPGFFSALIKPY